MVVRLVAVIAGLCIAGHALVARAQPSELQRCRDAVARASYDEAIGACEKASAADPRAFYELGVAYSELGSCEGAVLSFGRYLREVADDEPHRYRDARRRVAACGARIERASPAAEPPERTRPGPNQQAYMGFGGGLGFPHGLHVDLVWAKRSSYAFEASAWLTYGAGIDVGVALLHPFAGGRSSLIVPVGIGVFFAPGDEGGSGSSIVVYRAALAWEYTGDDNKVRLTAGAWLIPENYPEDMTPRPIPMLSLTLLGFTPLER